MSHKNRQRRKKSRQAKRENHIVIIASKLPPVVRLRMFWRACAQACNKYARHILNTEAPSFGDWWEKKGRQKVAERAEQGHSGAMALLQMTASPEARQERGAFYGLPPVIGGISGPEQAWVTSGTCPAVCENCMVPLLDIEFTVETQENDQTVQMNKFCTEYCAQEWRLKQR